MMTAPPPKNEAARVAALHALEVLDSGPEAEFDALVRIASMVCGTPISLISLVDTERQWFKANIGLPGASETPRDVAFCAHAILDDEVFEVPDATVDLRFADNPLVVDQPNVRFYAGAPVQLSDGSRVGTLCVIDRSPHQLTDTQRDVLSNLALAAAHALEGRRAMRRSLQLASELAEQHELVQVTLRSIGDAVISTDARGNVVSLNPAAERLTAWSTVQAKGLPLRRVLQVINAVTQQPCDDLMMLAAAQVDPAKRAEQALLLARDGRELGIEIVASPIVSDAGNALGMVIVFRDVTERRRQADEMSYRATHDPLTGLANRAEFEACLQRMWLEAKTEGTSHALMYIDLDRFKLVNDTCGHVAGDRLLCDVATMLRKAVRESDVVARLGGDEFAILLARCPIADARRIAQSLCDRMERFRFVHDEHRLRIGTSIGLVPADSRWETTAAILKAADTACYAAKQGGRNRVQVWCDSDATMHARSGETQWVPRIEKALDEDRFRLFAQRIVPLGTDAGGIHAEVLLRLLDSDGALILPGAFLPTAERFHLSPRIDRWVLDRAVRWMKSLPPRGRLECLNVNLSGQSVGDSDFHRWALDLLEAAGKPICERLCLEITETEAVTHMEEAANFIGQARRLGVRIALDDFGSGASSFGYLKHLGVDYLKIDGQFVRDLLDDPLDAAAVRCFVDVARVMGMKTVAEFVDRPALLQRVRDMGVDFAQGYLLHRPAPIDDLLSIPLRRLPQCGHHDVTVSDAKVA